MVSPASSYQAGEKKPTGDRILDMAEALIAARVKSSLADIAFRYLDATERDVS
ncbi:MAG: hypothetical protein OXF72_12915 [Gammaproteobacteria bacterium]|nr:hypothetical protein [Gammaproteobacteria bacterium]